MSAIRNILRRLRNGKASRLDSIRAELDRLVPVACSHRPGCLVARHEAKALRTQQLRLELAKGRG